MEPLNPENVKDIRSSRTSLAVVVLAAGRGTRMKSSLPKVLHKLAGKTLIEHVLSQAFSIGAEKVIVVVGHGREAVEAQLAHFPCEFVTQEQTLGTGHAIMQAREALRDFNGDVIVLSGDVPLLRGETLEKLILRHRQNSAAVTVLTADAPDPHGYGRILREKQDFFNGIIEERDANEKQRQIQEINSGIYCFSNKHLMESLRHLKSDNAKGEFYLTDTIRIIRDAGGSVLAEKLADFEEIQGINTVEQLSSVEALLNERQTSGNA